MPHRGPAPAGEGVGFGAACLLTGASVVVCAHFDQVDAAESTAMDHAVAEIVPAAADPVRTVSDVLRGAIRDRRAGRAGL